MDGTSGHARRRLSIVSANSAYSVATSAQHMLPQANSKLVPPNLPFASNVSLPQSDSPFLAAQSSLSLSVNYLPTKFSDAVLYNGLKNRGKAFHLGPKRGGGREAFRSGEARMPGDGDEDYDGIQGSFFTKEGGRTKPRLRWNGFKWTLFLSNFLFSAYSLAGTIFVLCTWFDVWKHADVVRVGNRTELIMSTIAAGFGVITSLMGWAGILLNNRSFLAVYTFFLWLCFVLLVTPGYFTFKRRNFNLDGKVNFQWGHDFGLNEWLRIQNQLKCCGFFSPFVEAAISQRWYTVVFGLVPFQIAVIVVGLLCSNHITYRFGKGMMPKAYRLSMNSMAVIMDNYASQLAEQYGEDVASEVLARSRSNVHLDVIPARPYASGTQVYSSPFDSKQDTPQRAS
ncbi:hypothetical protein BJV77DRAFT_1070179 [Russula vinacea]|nr:hypothetical protein BJV77DRAFT_1070179 [Russula vinacea]